MNSIAVIFLLILCIISIDAKLDQTFCTCLPIRKIDFCVNYTERDSIRDRTFNGWDIKKEEAMNSFVSIGAKEYDKQRETITIIHFCGGAIINEINVLTSARCLKQLELRKAISEFLHNSIRFYVAGGSKNKSIELIYTEPEYYREIESYVIYDKFVDSRKAYTLDELGDLAIIKLKHPFEFGNKTQINPACLVDIEIDDYNWSKARQLTLPGYGYDEIIKSIPDILIRSRKIKDENRTIFETPLDIPKAIAVKQFNISDCPFQICAYAHFSSGCLGDEGGPLYFLMDDERVKNKLVVVGLLSYSEDRKKNVSQITYLCHYDMVNYFTKIYLYLGWIRKHVEDDYCRL